MGHHPKLTIRDRRIEIDRRQFILTTMAVGGSLMVGISPVGRALAAVAKTEPWDQSRGNEFTAFISIQPDNSVVIRTTHPDIGNGAFSAAAMIVTEELKSDWNLVRAEFIPPNRDLKEGGEYSKTGTLAYFSGRSTGEAGMKQLLQIGASTRERLKAAAARQWGVDAAQVTADKSILTHTASGRTLKFADVAAAAATIMLPKEPDLTPRDKWTFLGKESPAKLNQPLIINGTAVYGLDVQVPGMVYAAIRQVPVHGGRLKGYNFDAIKGMPGVRAVVAVDPDEIRPGLPTGMRAPFGLTATTNGPQAAVAVIADHFWQAQTALDLLPVEWDGGEGVKWENTQQVYDALLATLKTPTNPNTVRKIGDAQAVIAAGKKIESTFLTPYMDHFNMEPLNGTALVTNDRVDVWMPTQHPQNVMYVAADETGIHPNNVHIHPTWVGTGLGRRVYGDDARMVVAIANKMRGTPVKVVWTREESIRQGRYRALVAGNLSATLGDDGMPKAIHILTSGTNPNARAMGDSPYQTNLPNYLVQTLRFNTNLMTGPWRGPVYNSNCFMIETFISELAETAKIDAIEFRKRLLAKYEDKSWIKLLDVVAEKSGWGKSQGARVAQGVAIGNWGMATTQDGMGVPYSGTTVAAVVTAEVSRRGEIVIPRVDVALDTGGYINADAVKAQVEGGVIMSIGAAMYEELNISRGRVVEGNLDNYRLIRQKDPAMPLEIHVHLEGMSGHERFSEAGEPPMGPPPAALAHAIFKVTGKWLRRHPFSKEAVA
jgi:isoquinoline 1-oxidoreductase beta subunit